MLFGFALGDMIYVHPFVLFAITLSGPKMYKWIFLTASSRGFFLTRRGEKYVKYKYNNV